MVVSTSFKNKRSNDMTMSGKDYVSGQPGTMNKTNTGSAGNTVGLSKGTDGPVVRMGGAKLK